MNKKNRITILILFLLFILLSISSSAVGSQPFIGEDDDYHKEISTNTPGNFFWTIYRNNSIDYSITVKVEGFEEWNQQVTPKHFVLSSEEPYQIVDLDFLIPKYPTEKSRSATISFEFRPLNETRRTIVEKNVFVEIKGIYTGEENTIIGGFTNPLPRPLNNPFGVLIINIVIWLFISFVIYFIIKNIFLVIARKTKTKLDEAIIEIIRIPVLVLILLYGIIFSIIRFGINISFHNNIYTFYSLVLVLFGVFVAWKIFCEILDEITKHRGGERGTFGKVLRPVFKKIGIMIIFVGGLIFGLSLIGVQVTALLAGAGIAGLVLAFAAQDTLSNYFSGMHLLLDKPFKIGDLIKIESGEFCRVENVGMRSTKLYSLFDHEIIVLPNNVIANQKIINIVEPDTKIRNRVGVSVAYGSDLEKVMKIIYKAAENHPYVIKEKGFEPLVRFIDFGDSGLKFMVIFWVDEVMNQWKAMSEIRSEIDKEFRKENITIPFPQRTVWLNKLEQKDSKDTNKEGTIDKKDKSK